MKLIYQKRFELKLLSNVTKCVNMWPIASKFRSLNLNAANCKNMLQIAIKCRDFHKRITVIIVVERFEPL